MDAEPRHVRDDQQRWVLQRERVLMQLVERRVEIGAAALVLPGETTALSHVGPSVAATVLSRAALGLSLPMIAKLLGHTRVQMSACSADLAPHSVKIVADRVADSLAQDLDTPPEVSVAP